ncbi:methyl-accepting chemotaxis protein [Psychromonas sp. GE-S-Ul-11]|uniref:methyl-accepting chemotaxis protein n=1 Tax=Psychromonas sp. GE-S-Ul-11 TaxID=3241170 RepID=UPI00390C5B05
MLLSRAFFIYLTKVDTSIDNLFLLIPILIFNPLKSHYMYLNFKGRIVSAAIIMLTVATATLSFISYTQQSNITIDNVDRYSMLNLSSNGDKIHEFIDRINRSISTSAELFSTRSDDINTITSLMLLQRSTEASAIVVGYEDGLAFNSNKGKYAASYDPRTRGWYQQAKRKGTTIITDIYTGSSTGRLMVSIAAPFYSNNVMQGVLLADVELNGLQLMVDNTVFSDATATLYTDKGLVLASSNRTLISGKSRIADTKALLPFKNQLLNEQQGSFSYRGNGQNNVNYFESIKIDDNTHWHLLITLDESVVYQVVDQSLKTSLLSTIALILIGSLVIYLLLSYTYRPMIALKNTVQALSSGHGDLTKRLPVTSQDDLGQISANINTFIDNLQHMMLDIAKASSRIDSSIHGLQTLTEENKQTFNQHKIETEQAVTALEEMNATSQDVAKNTSGAVEFTSKTNTQTEQSKVVVRNATQTVTELVKSVDDVSKNISEMGLQISEISKVLGIIGEIADQTNLLALNAAIEAARAGEHGRGFAVVADEVRALASRTQQSTTEIQHTINRLTTSGNTVTQTMKATRTSCEETSLQINLVVTDLDDISLSVEELNAINVQIATAAEEQSAVSHEINKNMAKISEMVERIATSGDDVNHEAINLADANLHLADIVKQFKLQ